MLGLRAPLRSLCAFSARQALSAPRAVPALARSYTSRWVDRETVNPPHVLNCLFTRNNTILTLSRRVQPQEPPKDPEVLDQEYLINLVHPRQEVILTVSTGQLGFRGTKKSTYDAAFQTSARLFQLMEDRGLLEQNIELVCRNFGENRQAFLNVLFGKEGTKVRKLIRRVTDGTRIKFGGDRSPNRRRV